MCENDFGERLPTCQRRFFSGDERTALKFLPACLREAQPCSGIVLLSSPKIGFSPRGGDTLPRAKFHVYRGRNVGIQPLKL